MLGMGVEVLVAHAREVRLIHSAEVKNDRLDAEKLARLCRLDPHSCIRSRIETTSTRTTASISKPGTSW